MAATAELGAAAVPAKGTGTSGWGTRRMAAVRARRGAAGALTGGAEGRESGSAGGGTEGRAGGGAESGAAACAAPLPGNGSAGPWAKSAVRSSVPPASDANPEPTSLLTRARQGADPSRTVDRGRRMHHVSRRVRPGGLCEQMAGQACGIAVWQARGVGRGVRRCWRFCLPGSRVGVMAAAEDGLEVPPGGRTCRGVVRPSMALLAPTNPPASRPSWESNVARVAPPKCWPAQGPQAS
jgi:hypothetical protein